MVDVVVLLGAPGAGKSAIGEELGRRGLAWREWEPELLERWDTVEAFRANKDEALRQHHADIEEWVDATPVAAVLETTGLSDASWLDRLVAAYAVFVVRLDVSANTSANRIRSRAQGRHLTDDPDASRSVWEAFHDAVVPNRSVDLVIDTEALDPSAAADQITAALSRRGGRPGR
jgi:shikimate kinase